jgi:predicted protein tyrosine phosphatase
MRPNYSLLKDWPTRIVSLTNDEGERHGFRHLHIHINDLEAIAENEFYPTPDHLQSVLAFTNDLTDDDRVLVHCRGGHRRGTAIAIGILIQHGMNYKKAFAYVEAIHPHSAPAVAIPSRRITLPPCPVDFRQSVARHRHEHRQAYAGRDLRCEADRA